MELSAIEASRLLFGLTAAFHFLFVPLTIGLMALIAILEGLALATGRTIYQDVARLYSWPFLVNFACGILTGYPLRSQIEVTWAGYSAVVAPLFKAVFQFEAHVAPFMFALVALFALGWRLKPMWHWLTSTALALVLIVQSAAILMLNAWMQKPVGTGVSGGQVQVGDITSLLSNPLFLPKLLHTVSGAWVLGGMLMLSVSAFYLLRRRHATLARAGFTVSARFTLIALLIAGGAGHWSGERLVVHQPLKFAAIEAIWESSPSPPDLVLFAWPDRVRQVNHFEVSLPGALGWVVSGTPAVWPSLKQQTNELTELIRQDLRTVLLPGFIPRLGYAGLLDPARPHTEVTELEIEQAARRALPNVALVFWSFRIMLGCWVAMLLLMLVVTWRTPMPEARHGRLLLLICIAALPLPWIAIEAGWLVCEAGRQPWTVTGVLATRASLGAVTADHAVETLKLALPAAAALVAANVASLLVHFQRGPKTKGVTTSGPAPRAHPARSAIR